MAPGAHDDVHFARYELEVPADPWPGEVTRHESIAEACAAGVQAEIGQGRGGWRSGDGMP